MRILFPCCATLIALLGGCSASVGTERIVPLNYLPALAGDYFALQSEVMGSVYHIYIRLPQDYSQTHGKKYPVVYLLDGDSAFPMIAPKHLFLTYDDQTPEAIIVGIAYGSFSPPINHREVDFGSRAADFQRFLREELIPEVEARTRADSNRRLLVGQSFGGSFVLYSAFTQPDLFWARVASNPSARMHRELLDSAPAAAHRSDLHLVIVSGSKNNAQGREAARQWVNRWRQHPTPWSLQKIDLEGGTHAADLGTAYRLALRRLFPLDSRQSPASAD